MLAKQAQATLDSVVGLIVEHLKAGDKLRLTGRNPASGESGANRCQQEDRVPAANEFKEAI